MPLTPFITYGESQLQPCDHADLAIEKSVNLAAGTYASGQVIGQITDTEVDAVQTITVTGIPTGGTFTMLGVPFAPFNSGLMTFNYNSTVAQAQPIVDAVYGPGNVIVTGTTLPAGSLILTFVNNLSAQPVTAITNVSNTLSGGTTPAAVITQTTPGVVNAGKFGAYAHGNSDGTQVAKGILRYGCVVDAAGNITGIGGDITGITDLATPAFFTGRFRIEHLVGLPTSGNLAVDFPGARVAQGDLVSGILALF